MIALWIVLAYFGIGVGLARLFMPHFYDKSQEWSSVEYKRSSMMGQAAGMIATWPIYLLVLAVKAALGAFIESGDRNPYAIEQRMDELADREREIRKMERELGIGRDR